MQACSSIGRAPVSKTGGCRFDSCRACHSNALSRETTRWKDKRIETYFNETRTELKKVTWPTREELKESTRVVIVATFLVTVFIGDRGPDLEPDHQAGLRIDRALGGHGIDDERRRTENPRKQTGASRTGRRRPTASAVASSAAPERESTERVPHALVRGAHLLRAREQGHGEHPEDDQRVDRSRIISGRLSCRPKRWPR